MAFHVEIEPQVLDDLESIAAFIQKHSSFAVAEKWFNRAMADIYSLKKLPGRCPVALESEELCQQIRILLNGRAKRAYRIYYSIDFKTPSTGVVHVLHVRHWARKPLGDDELQELIDDTEDGEALQ